MGLWYHVAEPNSYLVITGAGIEKVTIKKKVILFSPAQPFTRTAYLFSQKQRKPARS
jgi:flotillin